MAMQTQAARAREEIPRSLSDWALDAAFQLEDALGGHSADATALEGFFAAFRASDPYRRSGHGIRLVDATARDRVRGALMQVLGSNNEQDVSDEKIYAEIKRLTDTSFRKRLAEGFRKSGRNRFSVSDRQRAKQLHDFILKLHTSLISERVGAAVNWRDQRDE